MLIPVHISNEHLREFTRAGRLRYRKYWVTYISTFRCVRKVVFAADFSLHLVKLWFLVKNFDLNNKVCRCNREGQQY